MTTRLTDRAAIRAVLEQDRVWALYALADLDDELFAQCEWFTRGRALGLVFHGISIRPIFVMGDGPDLRDLLAEMPVDWGYLNLQKAQWPQLNGLWTYSEQHSMQRMVLDSPRLRREECAVLGPEHAEEIRALYATGDGGGVAFSPQQLTTGFFRGLRRGGDLVAVGGVHVVSRAESVAGVGNIFTRPDCRGQGLAQTVTSAVTAALLDAGLRTIGLNVEDTNAPAIAAYRKLGYAGRFTYVEGPAHRASTSTFSPDSRESS